MFTRRSISRLLGDAGLGIAGLLLGAGLFLLVTAAVGDEATAAESTVTIAAPAVPASPAPDPAAAVAALLDAEIAGDGEAAFVLLSAADRRSYPSPSFWADRQVLGPIQAWSWVDRDALITRLQLTPGLSTTTGWVPAESVVTWSALDEDGWRLSLAESVVEPITIDEAGAVDAAGRWLADPERCARPAVPSHPTSAGFADLCATGGVLASSSVEPVTGRTASDLSLTYGEGVSTWARTVKLEGGRHLLVVSIGSEWVVIDAMTP